MKIAVIGTGKVGGTLGQRWRAAGHDVAYGSRAGSGDGPGGAAVMTAGEALGGADVVVLAVPGGAVAEIVAANSAALAGKVVVDAANRMGEPEGNSRAAITAAAPDARYVRAFNTSAGRISLTRPRAPRCSSPQAPAPGRLPRNSSARLAWSRSSPATLRRAARWTPWYPCGSPWSGTTAGTRPSRRTPSRCPRAPSP